MKRTFASKTVSTWLVNWYREIIRHPRYRWWIVLGSLVYLLNPFDVLPDMVPIAGWIDDGLLATILVTEVAQLMRDRFKAEKAPTTILQTSPTEAIEVEFKPVN